MALLWLRSRIRLAAATNDPAMVAIRNLVAAGDIARAAARLNTAYHFDNSPGLLALRQFSLTVLRQGLRERSIFERCFAACALAGGGEEEGVKLLVETFERNPNLSVKMAVADGLGEDGDRRAVQVLSALYHAARPYEQRIIVEGLASATDPSAVTVLMEASRASERMVRLEALRSLGPLGNRRAIPLLHQVLVSKERDAFERVMAARSLLLMGDKSGVPYLRAMVGDRSQGTYERAVAAAALGFASDPSAVPVLKLALADHELEVRIGAAAALTHYREPAGAEYLKHALANADYMTRLEISELFGDLDAVSGSAVVLAGLYSNYGAVRLAAIKALAAGHSERNAELLDALARDSDDATLRAEVAWALGRIGSPGSIPTLLELVQEQDPMIRYTAADGLNRIATRLLRARSRWLI